MLASVVKFQRDQLFANGFFFVPVDANKIPSPRADWTGKARSLTIESVTAHWPQDSAPNTGILCDGLQVVDIDTDDPALAQWITTAAQQVLGGAPIRFRENSVRRLLVYRSADERAASCRLSDSNHKLIVEVLGVGRQFVGYGNHPSGVAYQWLPEHDLLRIKRESLREVLPDQIASFLNSVAQHVGGHATRRSSSKPEQQRVAKREPATKHEFDYAQKALRNEVEALLRMGLDSGRNRGLYKAAFGLGTLVGSGWIERKQAEQELYQASVQNGYVGKDGEQEARSTLRSGIEAGILNPRDPLPVEALGALPANLVAPRTTKRISKAPPAISTGRTSVELVGMGDVVEKPITWLWPGYLPSGALTLLAGQASTGKSTLSFGLAATVSNGGNWPDGTRCQAPGTVLIWSGEDDLATTIKPRLMAAGAAMERIGGIKSTVDEQGLKLPFDPSTDMGKLREAAARLGGVALRRSVHS